MSRIGDDDSRKQQIRAAAVRCFVRRGFSATRLMDIARQAGLSKGGVYFYYNTKEALFADVLEAQLTRLRARWAFSPASDQPADATLTRVIVAHLRSLEDEPDEARLTHLLVSMAPQEAVFRAKLEEGIAILRTLYSNVIHRGVHERVFRAGAPEMLADLVLATVHGLAIQAAADPEGRLPVRPEIAAQTLVSLLAVGSAALARSGSVLDRDERPALQS